MLYLSCYVCIYALGVWTACELLSRLGGINNQNNEFYDASEPRSFPSGEHDNNLNSPNNTSSPSSPLSPDTQSKPIIPPSANISISAFARDGSDEAIDKPWLLQGPGSDGPLFSFLYGSDTPIGPENYIEPLRKPTHKAQNVLQRKRRPQGHIIIKNHNNNIFLVY